MTEIAYLEKNRNSAFELMRIICMFLIILGHCTLATAENTEPYLGIMDNTGWLIKSFTVCSVNCFFLLTGVSLLRKSISVRFRVIKSL